MGMAQLVMTTLDGSQADWEKTGRAPRREQGYYGIRKERIAFARYI